MLQVIAGAIASAAIVSRYNFGPLLHGLLQYDPKERLSAPEAVVLLGACRRQEPREYMPRMA
mgnify:CR=1 FL=1